VRDRIRVYNTCAGYGYNTTEPHVPAGVFRRVGAREHQGPYEDLAAWQDEDRAADVARSLLDMGITAMKIWPFDQFADETNGQHISLEQLEQGLRPFWQIREAVGSRMDIAVELHSRWNLPSALRIAAALKDVRPMWIEDPVRMDSPDVLAEFAAKTAIPTTASETVTGRHAFRHCLISRRWRSSCSTQLGRRDLRGPPHRGDGGGVPPPVRPRLHGSRGVRRRHTSLSGGAECDDSGGCARLRVRLVSRTADGAAYMEQGWVSPPQGPGLGTRLVPVSRSAAT